MCPAHCKFLRVYSLLLMGALLLLQLQAGTCVEQCCVSRVQIGAEYTRARIKVGRESSFKGNLGGIQGLYEYKPWNALYEGFKIAWKQGTTDNCATDRKLVYVDAEERIGYTYAACCGNWTLTGFSGFGYRYLEHKLSRSEEDLVKLRYNTFYVPVGFLSEYCFRPCWSLGLNVTWMPQVFPTVEIVPLKGAHWSLKHMKGNVLVEVPLTFACTRDSCMAFMLKPFYEHWEDGRSTAKTSNGEKLDLPKNIYHFWGLVVSLMYAF